MTGPTIRTAGVRAAAFVALLALLLGSVSPVRAAVQPWSFPGDRDKKSAEKRYGSTYWEELYLAAVERFRQPNANLDEVIDRLRLAISYQPDSGLLEDRRTQRQIEYFPYHYLAQAFSKKRDYKSAQKCAEKESLQRKILDSKLADAHKMLVASIDAVIGSEVLLALATEALSWEGGKKEVALLAPESAAQLPQIKSLVARFDDPSSNKTILSNELKDELARLCKGEIQTRSAVLAQTLAAAWRPAFPAPSDRPDPSVCQAPPFDGKTEAIQAGLDVLRKCNTAVIAGVRRAGTWGCASLSGLRGGAEAGAKDLRTWSEWEGSAAPALDPLPEMPSSCASRWSDSVPPKLFEGFKALDADRGRLAPALEAKKKDIDGRLAEKRGRLKDKLRAAQAGVPEVPPECAQTLQLGEAAAKLAKLRAGLSPERVPETGLPSRDLLATERSLEPLLADLVVRAREGARQLQQNADAADLSKANLSRLPKALDEFAGRRGTAGLQELCATVKAAAADVRDWLGRNMPVVRANIGRTIDLLDATVRALPTSGSGCLTGRLSELKSLQPRLQGATALTFVNQAQSALGAAQVCLKDFHKEAEERFASVGGRIAGALKMFDEADAPQGKDGSGAPAAKAVVSLPEGVVGTRNELRDLKTRTDRVASLYQGTPKPADVRKTLEGAGLAARPAEGVLRLLDEGAGGKAPDLEAALVARDAAVLPELARAEDALGRGEPFARKLGPFAALNRAYRAFATGDLDGAILSMREAQREGRLPNKGREGAVAHAALAYFLCAKARSLSSGDREGDVAESMKEEVQVEARLAFGADAGFSLPDRLFPGKSIRDAIQAYGQTKIR